MGLGILPQVHYQLPSVFENKLVPTGVAIATSLPNMQGPGQGSTQARKTAAKFLISQSVAGVIIGKNGTNIADIQNATSTRIQLSRSSEHYPGTNERVMIIYGTTEAIIHAVKHTFDKVSGIDIDQLLDLAQNQVQQQMMNAAGGKADDPEWTRYHCEIPTSIKLVLPAVVCGAIIGRQGDNIRKLCVKCGANISVSPRSTEVMQSSQQACSERVITIRGGPIQLHRAVQEILSLVADDPQYFRHPCLNTIRYEVATTSQTTLPPPLLQGIQRAMPQANTPMSNPCQASTPINTRHLLGIAGDGNFLQQIQSTLGVSVTLDPESAQPAAVSGIRTLRIVGSPDAVWRAQHAISLRVQQANVVEVQQQLVRQQQQQQQQHQLGLQFGQQIVPGSVQLNTQLAVPQSWQLLQQQQQQQNVLNQQIQLLDQKPSASLSGYDPNLGVLSAWPQPQLQGVASNAAEFEGLLHRGLSLGEVDFSAPLTSQPSMQMPQNSFLPNAGPHALAPLQGEVSGLGSLASGLSASLQQPSEAASSWPRVDTAQLSAHGSTWHGGSLMQKLSLDEDTAGGLRLGGRSGSFSLAGSVPQVSSGQDNVWNSLDSQQTSGMPAPGSISTYDLHNLISFINHQQGTANDTVSNAANMPGGLTPPSGLAGSHQHLASRGQDVPGQIATSASVLSGSPVLRDVGLVGGQTTSLPLVSRAHSAGGFPGNPTGAQPGGALLGLGNDGLHQQVLVAPNVDGSGRSASPGMQAMEKQLRVLDLA